MVDIALIHLRNSLRVAGLILLAMGLGLSAYYQYWGWFHMGEDVLTWSLDGLIHIPRWLRQASPLVQGLCGWPLVLVDTVPLPLLLSLSGLLLLRV